VPSGEKLLLNKNFGLNIKISSLNKDHNYKFVVQNFKLERIIVIILMEINISSELPIEQKNKKSKKKKITYITIQFLSPKKKTICFFYLLFFLFNKKNAFFTDKDNQSQNVSIDYSRMYSIRNALYFKAST
jgi:hypothetical protein